MMSADAIKEDLIPKDGKWGFDISNLEAMLPAGTVDRSVDRVYKEVLRQLPAYSRIVVYTDT